MRSHIRLEIACCVGLLPLGCGAGTTSTDRHGAEVVLSLPRAPQTSTFHFLAAGDAGTGDLRQKTVGAAMARACAAVRCDFVLYLGDNIYESGLPDDPDARERVMRERFYGPYADIDAPFFAVTGNHDHGAWGFGIGGLLDPFCPSPARYQVRADADRPKGPRWIMPALHYLLKDTAPQPLLDLVALDTTTALFRGESPQGPWAAAALAGSGATWKMAFGHHTYLSHGNHGNAGEYSFPRDPNDGSALRALFDRLGAVADVIFTGHDHHLEATLPKSGERAPLVIVSGAAGKRDKFKPATAAAAPPLAFDDLGFVEATVRTATLSFTIHRLEDPCPPGPHQQACLDSPAPPFPVAKGRADLCGKKAGDRTEWRVGVCE